MFFYLSIFKYLSIEPYKHLQLVLLTVLLLLLVSISCKKESTRRCPSSTGESVLLQFNTEERGSDCTVRTHSGTNEDQNQKEEGKHFHWFDCHLRMCVCVVCNKIPDGLWAVLVDRKRCNSSVGQSQFDGMQQGRLATKVWSGKKNIEKKKAERQLACCFSFHRCTS